MSNPHNPPQYKVNKIIIKHTMYQISTKITSRSADILQVNIHQNSSIHQNFSSVFRKLFPDFLHPIFNYHILHLN